MTVKCNRTACKNVGIHTHRFNYEKYCSYCVFLIEENITLFGDDPCFDILRENAWQFRRLDKVYVDTPMKKDDKNCPTCHKPFDHRGSFGVPLCGKCDGIPF